MNKNEENGEMYQLVISTSGTENKFVTNAPYYLVKITSRYINRLIMAEELEEGDYYEKLFHILVKEYGYCIESDDITPLWIDGDLS